MTNDEVLDCDQDENNRSTESDFTELEHDLSNSIGSSNARRNARKRVNYKVSLDIFYFISMQYD